jgi:hypothetical protein
LYSVILHSTQSHDQTAEVMSRFLSLMSKLENYAKQADPDSDAWFIVTELKESDLKDVLESIFRTSAFNLDGTHPPDGSLTPDIRAWLVESYPDILKRLHSRIIEDDMKHYRDSN